jgi:prepilin-type N-terminal cleavage/methylation domain-containing protein
MTYTAARAPAFTGAPGTLSRLALSSEIMPMTQVHTRARRDAFTLMELLVVIAIIGIIAALLLAGVVAVMGNKDDVNNGNDINQLKIGLENFKNKFGVYPPGIIRLCSHRAQYTHAAADPRSLDAYSVTVLNKMWTKLSNPNGAWSTTGIDWSGTGNLQLDVTLVGDQCLVFFLGGIPKAGTGGNGFANDPMNPNNPNASRVGPWFQFDVGRLQVLPVLKMPVLGNVRGNGFPSYMDAYTSNNIGMPILYFGASIFNQKDGYYDSLNHYVGNKATAFQQSIEVTDPFGKVNLVVPYYNPTGTTVAKNLYNAYAQDSYQIVTAGRDQIFGPGGQWAAATAPAYDPPPGANHPGPPTRGNGQDDRTSFYDSRMGVQQ